MVRYKLVMHAQKRHLDDLQCTITVLPVTQRTLTQIVRVCVLQVKHPFCKVSQHATQMRTWDAGQAISIAYMT